MAAQEDSLLSPITAAGDRSESTTILVSERSGLPRVLQQAFDDGARPPPLLLAQVFQSIVGHEVPVANLSDPTSETALVYLIAIIVDGTAREEVHRIPNSWHTSLHSNAATARDTVTLRHRIAGPRPPGRSTRGVTQAKTGKRASGPGCMRAKPDGRAAQSRWRWLRRHPGRLGIGPRT
jgi:hypothetical protein